MPLLHILSNNSDGREDYNEGLEEKPILTCIFQKRVTKMWQTSQTQPIWQLWVYLLLLILMKFGKLYYQGDGWYKAT
jgi:hypothetical protein